MIYNPTIKSTRVGITISTGISIPSMGVFLILCLGIEITVSRESRDGKVKRSKNNGDAIGGYVPFRCRDPDDLCHCRDDFFEG